MTAYLRREFERICFLTSDFSLKYADIASDIESNILASMPDRGTSEILRNYVFFKFQTHKLFAWVRYQLCN